MKKSAKKALIRELKSELLSDLEAEIVQGGAFYAEPCPCRFNQRDAWDALWCEYVDKKNALADLYSDNDRFIPYYKWPCFKW